jgi:hypothetical protein
VGVAGTRVGRLTRLRAALPAGGDRAEDALALLLGTACALTAFTGGLYDTSDWQLAGLGILALALALVMARGLPGRLGAAAVASLGALALWAWISRDWSGSPSGAVQEAGRWFLYAAFLALALALVRDRRRAALLLGGASAAAVGVGLYVALRLTLGDAEEMFLGGRLNEPLGYVNGQAALFLIGLWPLVALAERAGNPVPAGAAAGFVVMLAGLVLLSQSRGVALAALVSVAAVLIAVPGRRRRAALLVVVGGGVAVCLGSLTDVYETARSPSDPPDASTLERADALLVSVSLLAGFAWGVAAAAGRRLRPSAAGRVARVFDVALAIGATVLFLAFLVKAPAIRDEARTQWDAFRGRSDQSASSRFLSGGGNRYDYWRVGLDEFTDHPLRGVGAAGYPVGWFRERRGTEDVRQPHSLELQALAETGLVGAALLGAFLVCVLAGLVRWARAARGSPSAAALAVAAGGAFVAWLAQTSVDWLHLIPGLTGLALAAAAVLLSRPEGEAARRPGTPVMVAAALLGAVGAFTLARPLVATHYRDEARATLPRDPDRAVREADDSLSLQRSAVATWYVRSAAQARRGSYAGAVSDLREALRHEPDNFVTWALLGDLALRRGLVDEARRNYRRALELNPRDPSLRELVRNPARFASG